MNLNDFLSGLVGGGLTFPAANFILDQLPETITRRYRFFIVLALAFALSCGAYGLQIWLGYAVYSPDGLFLAMTTGFTVSQAIWGARKA